MLAIIESPFAGATPEEEERNKRYLKAAIWDSLRRGEVPFASHGFYTHFLNDRIPFERDLGIRCGMDIAKAFSHAARYRYCHTDPPPDILPFRHVFYVDLGWSPGMLKAEGKIDVEPTERWLGDDWESLLEGEFSNG